MAYEIFKNTNSKKKKKNDDDDIFLKVSEFARNSANSGSRSEETPASTSKEYQSRVTGYQPTSILREAARSYGNKQSSTPSNDFKASAPSVTVESEMESAKAGTELRDATLKDLLWNSFKRGHYNSLYGKESYKEMWGKENEAKKYEDILAGDDYQFKTDNWLETGISGFATQLGQQVHQWTDPRSLGMAGTAVGGALAVGNLSPLAVVPEEIATIPAAAITGLQAGSAISNYEIEGGLAYKEMLEQGISEETAKAIATGVGGVNAALEFVQLDELVKAYKVLKNNPATDVAAESVGKQLMKMGVDVAGSVGKETLQEVAQEGTTITGVQLGSLIDKGEKAYTTDEVMGRLGDTALSSALTFGFMNVPSAGMRTVGIANNSKNYKAQEKAGEAYNSDIGALIDEGLNSYPTTESYQLATTLKGKLENGETITNREAYDLAVANQREIAAEERFARNGEVDSYVPRQTSTETAVSAPVQTRAQTIETRLAESGMDTAQASVVAQSLDRIIAGDTTVSNKDKDILSVGNTVARQIFTEETGVTLPSSNSSTRKAISEYIAQTAMKQPSQEVVTEAKPVENVMTAWQNQKAQEETVSQLKDIGSPFAVTTNSAEATLRQAAQEAVRKSKGQDVVINQSNMASLGERGKATYQKHIDNAKSVSGFSNAFQRYYDAGQIGVPFESIKTAYDGAADRSVLYEAYSAGVNDASVRSEGKSITEKKTKPKTKNKAVKSKGRFYDNRSREGVAVAEKDLIALKQVARAFNVDIEVVDTIADSEGRSIANGYYKNGKIVIAADSDNPMMTVLKHEITHHLQRVSPQKYKQFKDYVMKAYFDNSQEAMNAEIQRRILLANLNDMELTRAEAMDEIVADATESFLTDRDSIDALIRENRSLGETILNAIRDVLRKVEAALKGENLKGYSGFMNADQLRTAEKMWVEALAAASQNEIGIDSVTISESSAPVWSLKSMKFDLLDGKMQRDLVEHGILTVEEADHLMDEISKLIDDMSPFAHIVDMNEEYGKDNRPFSVYKPNSDPLYKVSLDFSTLCKKRLMTQFVMESLQTKLGKALSAKEQIAIRSKLEEYGKVNKQIQVACALCYVEARRLKAPDQINRFLDNRTEILTDYFGKKNKDYKKSVDDMAAKMKVDMGYEADTALKAMKSHEKKKINTAKQKMMKEYTPTAEEQKIIDRANAIENAEFLSQDGLTRLNLNEPVIYDAFVTHVRNATKSKALEGGVPYYYGDSKSVSDALINAMNAENGLRHQSWSDFEIVHLLDTIAAVIDLSVRKAKVQSYTKVPAFVHVNGNTGMMINLSLIPAGSNGMKDGKLDFSPVEGMDYNVAVELRDQYHKTSGTIAIGIDDTQINMLLDDPTIDYVIPYHTSGMNAQLRKMAGIAGWADYESYQSEKEIKGAKQGNCPDELWHKKPDFSEWFDTSKLDMSKSGVEIMREAANRYLQLCKERGLSPKFSNSKKHTDFSKHKDYWKLLIDRKMVDGDGNIIIQQEVRPDFDFAKIREVVQTEIDNYDPTLLDSLHDQIFEAWEKGEIKQREAELLADEKAKKKAKKKAAKVANGLMEQVVAPEEKKQFSLKGEKANLAIEEATNLQAAKQMKKDGKSNSEIRGKTGWWQGVDGKWRFEIDDYNAKINRYTGDGTLDEFLDHKELFRSYPILKNIMVYVDHANGSEGGNTIGNEIHLSPKLKGDEFKKALLHEIQHTIQEYEGNEIGSNLDVAYRQLFIEAYNRIKYTPEFNRLKTYRDRVTAVENEIIGQKASSKSLMEDSEKLYSLVFDQYYASIGETEARNTADRIDMTAAQRKANAPYMAESGVSTKNYRAERDAFRQIHKELGQRSSEKIDAPVYNNVRGLLYGVTTRGVNSLTRQVLNEDIRYSLKDSDYMAAVESGDTETVQAMVDQAAKKAGYKYEAYHGTNAMFNVFSRELLGSKNFMAESATKGFFAAASKETAENYTGLNEADQLAMMFNSDSRAEVERLKAKYGYDEAIRRRDANREKFEEKWKAEHGYHDHVTKIVDTFMEEEEFWRSSFKTEEKFNEFVEHIRSTAEYDWNGKVIDKKTGMNNISQMHHDFENSEYAKEVKELDEKIFAEWSDFEIKRKGYTPNVKHLYVKLDNPLVYDFEKQGRDVSFSELMDIAKERGCDGCIFKNVQDGADFDTIYTVFDNTQFKSADPVTYDDDGNVIPLSKRFNAEEQDIRYQLKSADEMLEMSKQIAEAEHKAKAVTDAEVMSQAINKIAKTDEEKAVVRNYQNAMKKLSAYEQELATYEATKAEHGKGRSIYTDASGKVKKSGVKYSAEEKAEIQRKIELWKRNLRDIERKEAFKKVLAREKADMAKRHAKEISKLRASYDARLADLREKRDAKIEAQKQKMRDYKQDQRDSKAYKEMKGKLEADVKWLNERLDHPTDAKHIPEEFKAGVAAFLKSLDFETKYTDLNEIKNGKPSQKVIRLRELNEAYQKILADQSSTMELDAVLLETLKQLEKVTENRRVADLTYEELSLVRDAIHYLKQNIVMSNKFFNDIIKESVSVLGDKLISEQRSKKARKDHVGVVGAGDKLLNYDSVTPADKFHEYGGVMEKMYKEIRKGFNKHIENTRTTINYVQDLLKGHENALKEWSGDNAKTTKFTISDGTTIELTPAQVMSLYCLMKREQAVGHVLGSGIVPSNVVVKEAKRYGKLKLNVAKKITSQKASRCTIEDIQNIVRTLTEDQRKVADGIVKLFTTKCADWGNETSMKLYGYKKFTEANYFPIKSSDAYLNARFDDGGDPLIKNLGFTKNTVVNANNPVVVDDIFDVLTDHANKMSMYNALVVPLTDFSRVFNYKTKGVNKDGEVVIGDSVQKAMETSDGQLGVNYVKQFIKDVNKEANSLAAESFALQALSNYKKAKIAASSRVLVQQPTSITRAANMVDPKYLVEGLKQKANYEELFTYSEIAYWKSLGFYQTDVSRSMRDIILSNESKLDQYTMGVYGKADDFTWGHLWNAIKLEQADAHPNMDKTSSEFMDLVKERFEEVVDRTQVVDSVFHRSQIMRSKGAFAKMATAFMSESTKQYNLLRTELMDASKTKDKQKAARAIATYVANAVVVSAFAAIVDAIRDDEDEDEEGNKRTLVDKYIDAVLGNIKDNINPLNLVAYLKEISSLWSGYSVNRMDMASLSELIKTANKWTQGRYTAAYMAKETAEDIAELCGIPLKNAVREVTTIIGAVGDLVGGHYYADYMVSKTKYNISNPDNRSVFYKHYTDALAAGDQEAADLILTDMVVNGIPYDNIISKGYQEQKQIAFSEARKLISDGKTEEAKKLIRKLAKEYDKKYTTLWKAVKNGDPADTPEETYDYKDLKKAVRKGEDTELIEDYLIEYGGYSEEAMEEAIKMLTEKYK